MDAIQCLMTRRSVRAFTPEPVTEAEIRTILSAAMHAPSACNQQPWHFIVIDKRAALEAIARVHPYAQMLLQAPLAVVVCADRSLETCHGYWPVDCSAATENLLLAAHAIGLGGVWVGVYPVEERVQAIHRLLALPQFVTPLCLAAIGRPAEPLPQVDRFVEERIHRNGWKVAA